MKGLRTFSRGGVHPPQGKADTSGSPIRSAPLPAVALVPFSQHTGTPARPLVSVGDRVEEAQMIGEPTGFLSAAVHSPIPGTITDIRRIYLPSGVKTDAAAIELVGEFSRSGKALKRRDWSKLSAADLLDIIKNRGVVGQGGAAFPAHIKYSVPKGRTCSALLVNGAECEPYISADHRLMVERPGDLVEGMLIVRRILKAGQVVIGIESNKPDAIAAMSEAAGPQGIRVVPLKAKYPQGAEKNLVEALLGLEVPSGKLPIEIGVVNVNAGTLLSVYEAVRHDMPVIERVVTVAGGAVREPGNIRVRVGSAVRDIIDECGGLIDEPEKFVWGGPMMGFAFSDLDSPISKGTSGILALTAREVRSAAATACISCGRCVDSCPMGLVPTQIFKNIDRERLDAAAAAGLDECVLCGACAYACPAYIPLVSAFRAAKGRRRRLASAARSGR